MQDKKYLYPILNFVEIQKPSYWNFNNLAVIVFSDENIFKEVSNNNFLIGDVSQNKYCKYYFNFSNISEFVETTTKKPSGLWENTFEVINIFLLNYKIENKVVSNKLIFHGVKSCVYPDSEQLDLAVKDKLINIEHEWTFQEQREIPLLSKNKIYWFFENHFNSYQGDPNDFLNHSEELINNIWQDKNLPNLKRKKYFNEWLNEKKIELQELGFETVTNSITPHQTLSIEPSDQAEENKTKVKLSIRAIALYYVFRIEKGIELPFDKRTPNKTKAIETVTSERQIDNREFRREWDNVVNNPSKRINNKYEKDYRQAIQLLNEDKNTNKEAIILAKDELKIINPLG